MTSLLSPKSLVTIGWGRPVVRERKRALLMFPEPVFASRTASALYSGENTRRVLFSINISLPQPKAAQGVHEIEGGFCLHPLDAATNKVLAFVGPSRCATSSPASTSIATWSPRVPSCGLLAARTRATLQSASSTRCSGAFASTPRISERSTTSTGCVEQTSSSYGTPGRSPLPSRTD